MMDDLGLIPGAMVRAPGQGPQTRRVAFGVPHVGANHDSPVPETSHEQIAKDFESVLLTRLFDQVQESIGTWQLDEDGTSQQVQGMFWFYLAQEAADQGGLGLWKDICQHLRQMDCARNVAGVIDEEL